MSRVTLPPPVPGTRRVVLHVGAPKSGTTYLQSRLQASARTLAGADVHVPRPRPWDRWNGDPSFRAALDLLGEDWGGPSGHPDGAWSRLVAGLRPGTTVISHEILAGADDDVVRRARADLSGVDLHVVFTARDLGRALPAAWQESIKQGRKWSYGRFLARAQAGRVWFMRALDFPAVLGRWGAELPPENLHLVVVPPRGSAPGLLWERFCAASGIDPALAAAPRDALRRNPSLGVPEVQLLRLLNRRQGDAAHRDPERQYLLVDLIAEGALARRPSPRVVLPPEELPWVQERTAAWAAWARATGVDVVGDLGELEPEVGERFVDPDRLRPRKALEASLDALQVLLEEAVERKVPLRTRLQRRAERAVRPH